MKPLFILLLSLLLISCASRRDGCGKGDTYRHQFRVEKINRDRTGQFIVTLRNGWNEKRYMVCCSLPDSLVIGKTVTL